MADTLHILIVRLTPNPDHAFVPALQAQGFLVHTTIDVVEGRNLACRYGCALVLLELDVGAILDVVGYLRSRTQAPLLLLAGCGRLEDVLAALVMGVDAYLVKPFCLADLLAQVHKLTEPSRTQVRIHADLLHAQEQQVLAARRLRLEDLVLDLRSGHCWRNDVKLDLTRTEFSLLSTFLRQQGCVLTYENLLRLVWDRRAEKSTNVVGTYIFRLRRKLDQPFNVKLLHTVRGKGYVLERRLDD